MASRNLVRVAVVLTAFIILADSTSALAQRRRSNFGGSNNNQDNDQNNQDGNNNNNNQGGNRRNRNRDNDSDLQQFQQRIQGGQFGQGNQDNQQQFRRRGQQGGQGFNNQQFQPFIQGGQNNQGNNWQSRRFDRRNDLQQWIIGFSGGQQPFSNDWYHHHPHAWQHHRHDNDDFWKVATAATVFNWLGWQAQPHHHHSHIVYDPVPETYFVESQPGAVVDAAPGQWLTLGAYTLRTSDGDQGTRILELAVDKQGRVRGSYFDMITNATQNVFGVIDQSTQQARWSLETNRQLTFVTTMDQLTQPQGVVNVKLPGGQVQQWQLVRMER